MLAGGVATSGRERTGIGHVGLLRLLSQPAGATSRPRRPAAPKPLGTPRADASSPILLLQLFIILSLLQREKIVGNKL
jgi:hypothetical protein